MIVRTNWLMIESEYVTENEVFGNSSLEARKPDCINSKDELAVHWNTVLLSS